MRILERDLAIERLKGSGPGGQRRNKRETGVRITHLPTGITAMATEERSQALNLKRAKERLAERLAKLLRKRKKRIPTSIPASAHAARIEHKKTHSRQKSLRKPVLIED
jgi:protein subunit release factor B